MIKILVVLLFTSNVWANFDFNNSEEMAGENIIIGDSLCTFIDNASKNANRLNPKGDLAGTYLWYGGTTLTWLKQVVNKYPLTPTVKNVIISVGTNSSFSKNDDIPGLVDSLKSKFPNAHLIVVPGSWWIKQPRGWVVTVSEETVKEYYKRFENLGASITTPVGDSRVCCSNDPHGNFPIYKTIGEEIDRLILENEVP